MKTTVKTIVIEATPCPRCGNPMPAGALAGLCPACLLAQGMATEEGGATSRRHFEPPPLAEVAKFFPQLEIQSLLGAGGMGAVYKARQPALDRVVALKILPGKGASGANFEERFNREARALARLNHPNIVAVFEFGQVGGEGGLHFFIMEFVDGANLRQLEQAGRLAPREALQIIPQICDALQYAHDEGVVHRDIKPENVLVDRKGRVKIADFGLAKILGQDVDSLRLTAEGQVMGTPHYMAPEQIERPLTVDHRADIYSLGVVLYEMLTGDLPLGKFAPPSRKYQLDVRLDDVVLRALENDPARRYQHASEVKSQVENIAGTPAPAVSAAPAPEPRTVRWASFPILTERHGTRRVVWKEALRAWAIIFGYLSLAFMLVSGITGRTPFGWLGLQGWPSVLMRAILAASMVAWGVRLAWRWPWDETRTPQGTVILPGNPWWRRPRWALLLIFLVGLTGAVFQRKSLQSSLADLLKAAPATPLKVAVNDSKTGTFIAKLPVRGTVELLAVSDAGAASNGWWLPNGTPVPDTSYDHADSGRLDFNGWAEKDLVLRWRDLPTGAEGPYLEFESAGAFNSGGKSWRNPKSFFGTRPVRAAFPPTATEATMRVGFDLAEWQTVSTHDRNGNGHVLKAPPGVPNLQAQVHNVGENNGAAHLTILVAKEGRDWKIRVIAVDTNGVEHPEQLGTSTPADKTSVLTCEFMGLPLARVKEFRVQVRPVHWIEFRGVALKSRGPSSSAISPKPMTSAARDAEAAPIFPGTRAQIEEAPQLRFLAWQDVWRINQPNSAWHPDGSLARESGELDLLRNVSASGLDVSRTEAASRNPRFLHLWFSHPLFDNQGLNNVTLLDENGSLVRLGADGSISSGIRPAAKRTGNVAWLATTFSPGEGGQIPARVTVRLRYAFGPLERPQEVAADFNGGMSLEANSQLNGIGQNAAGRAFLALAVDTVKSEGRHFGAVALTRDGRELLSHGRNSSGNVGSGVRVENFEFNLPLAEVARFRIGTRPVRTMEWTNVVLRNDLK